MAKVKYTVRRDLPEATKKKLYQAVSKKKGSLIRCSKCKQTFNSKKSLQRHFREKHPGPTLLNFQCTDCFFESPRKETVARHRNQLHPDVDPTSAIPSKLYDPKDNAATPRPWVPPVEARTRDVPRLKKNGCYSSTPIIKMKPGIPVKVNGYTVKEPYRLVDDLSQYREPYPDADPELQSIPASQSEADMGHQLEELLKCDLHLSSSSDSLTSSVEDKDLCAENNLADDLYLSSSTSSVTPTPADNTQNKYLLPQSTEAKVIVTLASQIPREIFPPLPRATPDLILDTVSEDLLQTSVDQETYSAPTIDFAVSYDDSFIDGKHPQDSPPYSSQSETQTPGLAMFESRSGLKSTAEGARLGRKPADRDDLDTYITTLGESPLVTSHQIALMPPHQQRCYGIHWPEPHHPTRWTSVDLLGTPEGQPPDLLGWTVLDEYPRVYPTPYQWGDPGTRPRINDLTQYQDVVKRYPRRLRKKLPAPKKHKLH